MFIWEVDDDNDQVVDWEEFRTMFYRTRDDTTGCEPRKLFNVVDFLMLDKNHSGSVDMDECITLLWQRYGKDLVEENLKAMKKENNEAFFNAVRARRPPRPKASGRAVGLACRRGPPVPRMGGPRSAAQPPRAGPSAMHTAVGRVAGAPPPITADPPVTRVGRGE